MGFCKLMNKTFKEGMQNIILAIVLFFAIFLPPITIKSIYNIIISSSILTVLLKLILSGKIEISKRIFKVCYGFAPFLIWYMISTIIHLFSSTSNDIIIKSFLVEIWGFWGILIFLIALTCINNMLHIGFDRFCEIIFITFSIQLIIVLATILFPDIKTYLNNLMVQNTNDLLMQRAIFTNRGFRCYGFAINLFDSFGYITSLAIILTFSVGMKRKNSKILILSLLFMIMPLFNARTGLLLSGIGILAIIIFYTGINRRLINLLIIIIFVTVMGFNSLPEETRLYITNGVTYTFNLFGSHQDIGFYQELSDDIIFPESIFLGAGASPETLVGLSVDVGYVQCIWRYGMIGTMLFLLGVINTFRITILSTNKKMIKALCMAYLFVFLVYLIKLFSIQNFGGNILLFGVPVLILNSEYNKSKYSKIKNVEQFEIA